MRVIHTIKEIREYLRDNANTGHISLVPTMGALHDGHLQLVRKAKKESDFVIATIFVNPAQFNNPQDLEKYPVQTDQDLEKLRQNACDMVFMPQREELYPREPSLRIDFGTLETALEGEFRPGHFAGVGLIISKLFNIIQPDHAFFGQKDIQQFFVIKKLTEELNFQVQLHMVPTVREVSGLAMSSRNLRLSPAEQEEAALIYRCLIEARKALLQQVSIEEVKQTLSLQFSRSQHLDLEYFEIVDTSNFLPLSSIQSPDQTALCIAAVINEVRLIDNLPLFD